MRKKLYSVISIIGVFLLISSLVILNLESEDPEGAYANPINIERLC